MPYGSLLTDVVQSSTAGTPPQFNDGNGTQTGTLCRAWVNFNGVTTATIRASFNVSSVTRNGTGDYTVNFTTALSDTNYSAIGTGSTTTGGAASNGLYTTEVLSAGPAFARTTSAYRFYTLSSSFNAADGFSANIAIFR